MKVLHTDIVDTTDPVITGGQSRFITKGLGLEVIWENLVKDAIIISNDNKTDIEVSIASAVNKGYNSMLAPSFISSWDVKNKVHSIAGANIEFVNSIRNMRHNMSHQDLCQVLNHAQAWIYSVQKQRPVIVIEAGTLLNTKVQQHTPRNSIINLTNKPLKQINENWYSFQGVQCYCIDQFASKQLLAMLYTQGIRDTLPTMIRDDLFCICKI